MTAKDKNDKSVPGQHRPRPARTSERFSEPMKNVCSECRYYNDHSPTCSKRPK